MPCSGSQLYFKNQRKWQVKSKLKVTEFKSKRPFAVPCSIQALNDVIQLLYGVQQQNRAVFLATRYLNLDTGERAEPNPVVWYSAISACELTKLQLQDVQVAIQMYDQVLATNNCFVHSTSANSCLIHPCLNSGCRI